MSDDAPVIRASAAARVAALRASDARLFCASVRDDAPPVPAPPAPSPTPTHPHPTPTLPWTPAGHLVEATGKPDTACTSFAAAAIAETQRDGGTTVWIQRRPGRLFPPDLAACGVDLDALLVVHVPHDADPHGVPRAAELLLRSGAFDLVVLDVRPVAPTGGAWLGRLQGLARQHRSRVLLLTETLRAGETFGCFTSLRFEPRRVAVGATFAIEPRVTKDRILRHHAPPLAPRCAPHGLT